MVEGNGDDVENLLLQGFEIHIKYSTPMADADVCVHKIL